MRTRAQVEHLKIDWKADPTWDIEDTNGFEDYKDELRIFSENCIAKWADEAGERHAKLATLYCPIKMAKSHVTDIWECEVEKCAWWNSDVEKCHIRTLS